MHKKLILAAMASCLAACASPQLMTSHTASDEWTHLSGNREKGIASQFYNLGQGDAMMRWYLGQRAQQAYSTGDPNKVSLQRTYRIVPIPEHVDSDGTIKEASNAVIETVQ